VGTRTYEDDAGLQARVLAHQRYSEHSVDFYAWVVEHAPWQGGEHILDVGCGNGALFPYWVAHQAQITALDRSPGMIARARARGARARLLVGDAQALPFPDATFDLVFAVHVFFLVEDVDAALREAWRVLKWGGHLVASTNTEESQAPLYEIHNRALSAVGRPPSPPPHLRFPLGRGTAMVRKVFGNARVDVLHNAFLFPSVDPAWDYYMSGIVDDVGGPPLTPEERARVGREARSLMDAIFARRSVWRIPKDAGVIVAQKLDTGDA